VDLGADAGGNCELSKPDEVVTVQGVRIFAPTNLPARMPAHASLLFSRNLTAFITAFTKAGAFTLDLADEIQKGSLVAHQGEIVHPRVKDAVQAAGLAAS
jgi:NAD(P) transhydrogenase subunit alpha